MPARTQPVRLVVAATWALAIIACEPDQPDVPADQAAILHLRGQARVDAMHRLPLDDQVSLYVIAMLRGRPPEVGLAHALAENGAPILPAVLRRIREERDDVVIWDLLEVLRWVDKLGHAPVGDDPEVMAFLRSKVAAMRDDVLRRYAEARLSWIKCGQPTPAFSASDGLPRVAQCDTN
jgi:hypothetical protein